MTSPTQRSKAALQKAGWTVAIVERWNPHARIRQDLFGFADLLAIKAGEAPLLVQVTSGAHVNDRKAKILDLETPLTALQSGMRIEVHGWRKLKVKRGGKAMKWEPRVIEITAQDFQDECSHTSAANPDAANES